jgi:replicative DNA helicase
MEFLFLWAAWFFAPVHGALWSAMASCAADGKGFDEIRVRSALKAEGKLDDAVDHALGELAAVLPDPQSVAGHAETVRNLAVVRRLMSAAQTVLSTGYGGALGDPSDFLDEAQSAIAKACDMRTSRGNVVHVQAAVEATVEGIQARAEAKRRISGHTTGNDDLDRLLSGLRPATMTVLAGRPAMGKTSAAMEWLLAAVRDSGEAGIFFSLEMPMEQLGARLLSHEGLIDGEKLRDSRLAMDDWPKMYQAADALMSTQLLIDDQTKEVGEVCRAVRREYRRRGGLSAVVVDYLQLMRVRGQFGSREQEVAEISRTLKLLSTELKIPVVALSQLNRSVESRTDKRPQISDLRESGAIEQDADAIVFIYRDEVYNAETTDRGIAEWIVGKNRHGATGTVKTLFRKEYTRFFQLDHAAHESHESADQPPEVY